MARPVNADAAATRKRILEEATRMFAERGPARSSIRAIAARARVSLGMVHHYFGSKGELYEACVEAMYVELGSLKDELVQGLGSATEVSSVLERAMTELFRFAREHATAVRLMMRTVVETGELDRERREAVLLPFWSKPARRSRA